jgi:hypothetical protein
MRALFRAYAVVFTLAFVVIASSHLLRARPLEYALREALLWSAVSAGVYFATRLFHMRRGRSCALCDVA